MSVPCFPLPRGGGGPPPRSRRLRGRLLQPDRRRRDARAEVTATVPYHDTCPHGAQQPVVSRCCPRGRFVCTWRQQHPRRRLCAAHRRHVRRRCAPPDDLTRPSVRLTPAFPSAAQMRSPRSSWTSARRAPSAASLARTAPSLCCPRCAAACLRQRLPPRACLRRLNWHRMPRDATVPWSPSLAAASFSPPPLAAKPWAAPQRA